MSHCGASRVPPTPAAFPLRVRVVLCLFCDLACAARSAPSNSEIWAFVFERSTGSIGSPWGLSSTKHSLEAVGPVPNKGLTTASAHGHLGESDLLKGRMLAEPPC